MNVLVTGGNGFIARHIKEQLGDKYTILAPPRQELDLLDHQAVREYFKSHSINTVVHAATYDAVPAHYNKDPNKVLENNLRMYFNIEANRGYFDHLINLGSGAEYSRKCWGPKMEDDDFGECIPEDQYGLSKYICAKLALETIGKDHYDDDCQARLTHLRLFAVFGKYEDWRVRFLSNAICRQIYDMPIKINQDRVFDFMYIDDFIRILDEYISKPDNFGAVCNVCSGKTYQFTELAKMIHKIGGKDTGTNIIKDGMGPEYSGDNSWLMMDLDDPEFVDMDIALTQLYLWYQERKGEIDPTLL